MMLNTVLKVYVPAQAFMSQQIKQFIKRTEGASGIEYALIAGMVAVALVAFVTPISESVTTIFGNIKDELAKVTPTGG